MDDRGLDQVSLPRLSLCHYLLKERREETSKVNLVPSTGEDRRPAGNVEPGATFLPLCQGEFVQIHKQLKHEKEENVTFSTDAQLLTCN